MNYRKIFFVSFLFLLCGSFLIADTIGTADTVWEGTAAMSRFGEFPFKGLYGASNSFPINTIISVENIKNKKTVEVIISDTLNDNNLFLLLSKDAAGMLDIKQDEISSVKIQIINESIADKRYFSSSDRSDSDLPESTILGDVAKIENILSAENPPVDKSLPFSSGKIPQKVVIIYDGEDSAVKEIVYEDAVADTDEVEIAEADADTTETYADEVIIADADTDADVIAETETEEPIEDGVAIEENPAEEVSDAVVIAEAEKDPVDAELVANAEVYYENGEKKYFLRPTSPRPPVVDDAVLAADNSAVVPAPNNNTKISKDSYYVQIIAFKDYTSAENVMKTVKLDSPVIIHYDKKESLYKVMAGPLKTDERGVVLYKAKNSGYKDAFIRKGE